MSLRFVLEAGDQRRNASVGFDFRGVEVELPAPNSAGLLTQIDDLLEEALKDIDPEALADAGQAGVIGQFLIKGVAEIPAMSQVETRGRDEVPLGADPSKNITSCSLKKTTGSMEGRPRSA